VNAKSDARYIAVPFSDAVDGSFIGTGARVAL
jgi:hypothetical protein